MRINAWWSVLAGGFGYTCVAPQYRIATATALRSLLTTLVFNTIILSLLFRGRTAFP